MQIYRSLQDLPQHIGPTVVTVGNFDGLHLAHRRVINAVIERARQLNATSVALTFEPHPIRILRPEQAPKLITPPRQKLRLLQETGIDAVVVLPFSRDLSMMPPFEFAEEILSSALHAVEVHEGFNFRFGHKAEGDTERLKEFGKKLGFEVVIYDPLRVRGKAVSSSQVRKLIAQGDVDHARHILGRSFSIVSNPGRGRGYGTKYTVPTINLARYDELVPKAGVYITRIRVANEVFDSITNCGVRPTFGDDGYAIETHVLNFHPIELTGETEVELSFLSRVRDEIKFESIEILKEQIGHDVAHAKRYFSLLERMEAHSIR